MLSKLKKDQTRGIHGFALSNLAAETHSMYDDSMIARALGGQELLAAAVIRMCVIAQQPICWPQPGCLVRWCS